MPFTIRTLMKLTAEKDTVTGDDEHSVWTIAAIDMKIKHCIRCLNARMLTKSEKHKKKLAKKHRKKHSAVKKSSIIDKPSKSQLRRWARYDRWYGHD
jgi:hypothetical protein